MTRGNAKSTGNKGKQSKTQSSRVNAKRESEVPVAKVNKPVKRTQELNQRSLQSKGTLTANEKETSNVGKRKLKSNIVFDEIDGAASASKGAKGGQLPSQTRSGKTASKINHSIMETKRDRSASKSGVVTARFNEGQQVMQMAVDAHEAELFDTEDSDSEPDSDSNSQQDSDDPSDLEKLLQSLQSSNSDTNSDNSSDEEEGEIPDK